MLQGKDGERISIHPPREGWDFDIALAQRTMEEFQSTHPVRGGTTTMMVSQ